MQTMHLPQVFIGFDRRETIAFNVLSHSLQTHSSMPLKIAPVMLDQLAGIFSRQRDPKQSTDFSFSRFLVPHLCGYEGWSLFMDCDILARDDITKLWSLRDEKFAVMVVKHDHVPKERTKFLGEPQTPYKMKNWSSVMLFNNALCRSLTPAYVNSASGLELHQFHWLKDESLIGDIPKRWNHLVGYDAFSNDAALVHFTSGGPYFPAYRDSEYADEWFAARDGMCFVERPSHQAA
jgi:hypothetical protein